MKHARSGGIVMPKARMEHRIVLCCPYCRSTDHVVYRRVPSGTSQVHVVNACYCRRCGAHFAYEENAEGKPVR